MIPRGIGRRPVAGSTGMRQDFGCVGDGLPMSTVNIVTGGYEIDTTPEPHADGRFTARAIITRQADRHVDELWPEFEPFTTEAEASAAAHLAALAWISHQPGAT